MAYVYRQHYTPEEARALLPQVRDWLRKLQLLRGRLEKYDPQMNSLLASGQDAGGATVSTWVRTVADMKTVLMEFQKRDIQIKELDRGLLDFPAILGGKEVFLCWEQDEEDIEFWHDLHSGYAGRERL